MTLATTTNKVILQGNGSTGTAGSAFSYSFIIPTAADAVVTYTDTAGTQTNIISSLYTITGLNDPDGGTLTYPLSGDAIPTGATLTLERVVPYTQDTVLTNQGAYYPAVVEAALDGLTMQTQQLAETLARTITANPADVSPTMELPVAALRASMYLGFDPSGNLAVLSAAGDPVWSSVLSTTGGTMTGPINETMATVSSLPTTADIWGATASDVIAWTGTATTTAFPDAPVAGARRTLVCAGACIFTAGANLEIEGIESGGSVTMKADAMVEVLAITTTKFKLRYSLSGTFTAVGTGFTTTASATWNYTVINGLVHITMRGIGIGSAQTATGTTFTITGFPAEILPGNPIPYDTRLFFNLRVYDSGSGVSTGYGAFDSTGVMNLYTAPGGAPWTSGGAAGDKIFIGQELQYLL